MTTGDANRNNKGLFRRLVDFALDYDVNQAVDEQLSVNVQFPDNAEGACNLGILLYSQGKVDKAIAAYTRAIQLDGAFASAHRNLGEIFVVQKRYELAWHHARKAEATGDSRLSDMLNRYEVTRNRDMETPHE